MLEADAVELIVEQFMAQWAIVQPTVPAELANEAATAPDTFVTCTVKHTTSQQLSTGPKGTRIVERKGYVFVKIWTPANKGTLLASQLADSARAALELLDIPQAGPPNNPVTVSEGETQELGTDGRWYMSLVRFPMRYYATV
jgi:hypothetical protein